jgi:hypothetical protein
MRRKAVVLAGACLLSLITPAPAHALWGGGWLERLSGPGPFRGQVIDHRFLCITLPKEARAAHDSLPDTSAIKDLIIPLGDRAWLTAVGCSAIDVALRDPRRAEPRLEVGIDLQLLHSAANALDYSQPGNAGPSDIGLRTFGVTADLRVNRVLDVGIGVGRAWFRSTTGTPFDGFSRAVLQPLRVSVRPLAFLSNASSSEAIVIRFDATKFQGTFTAVDFGAAPGTFNEPGEITWAWSIRIDPFVLLK